MGAPFTFRNVLLDFAIPGRAAFASHDFLANPGLYLFDRAVSALIPKPQVPNAIATASQVYNAASRQNLARLQGAQPVLYGRFRIYPDLLSQPWAEYVDNEQILYQLMEITQGQANLIQLYIGDTPIESFADVTYQLYQPGATVDLFHNNVATNEQVQDLTLVSVGVISAPSNLTFNAAAHTISCATAIFTDFKDGDLMRVASSLFNNGDHVIATVAPDFKSVVITGVLVDESYPTISTITGPGPTMYGPSQFSFGNVPIIGHLISDDTSLLDLSTLNPGDAVTVAGSKLNDGVKHVSTSGPHAITVTELLVAESSIMLSTVQLISRLVGPFYANPALTSISDFGVDLVFPRGLYSVDGSGNLTDSMATVKVEYRQVGTSLFTLAGNETFTAHSNTPQRFTRTYACALTGRIEVKVTRTSATATSSNEQNESHWTGLRGFLKKPVTITAGDDKPVYVTDAHLQYPDRTVLAVKLRATGQLVGAMQSQMNGVFQRLLRTWTGSAWTAPAATSSIAWAYADAITNAAYGFGRADAELDLATLKAFDDAALARGDFFNGYFDQAGTTWESLISIARVGRAVPIFDGALFSIVRDEPRSLRAALFTDQNTVRGSVNVSFDLAGDETAQGVNLSYFDPVTYQPKTIRCGVNVNATDVTLFGCTSRDQAWREGNFILNGIRYRRVNVGFGTEKDGFVPGFADLVTLQAAFPSWGQSARAIALAGNVITLDQSPDWSAPPHLIRLRDADGTPTAPLSGSGSGNQFTLDGAPPIAVYTGSDRERTHLSIGSAVHTPIDVLVKAQTPADEMHIGITGVMDDPRVYADPGATPAEDV